MIMVTLHTSLPYLPDLYFNAEVCLFVFVYFFLFFLFFLLQWFVVAWSLLLFIWFCLDMCINLDSYLLCDVLRLIVYVMNPFFFIHHSFHTRCRHTNKTHTTPLVHPTSVCLPITLSTHFFSFLPSLTPRELLPIFIYLFIYFSHGSVTRMHGHFDPCMPTQGFDKASVKILLLINPKFKPKNSIPEPYCQATHEVVKWEISTQDHRQCWMESANRRLLRILTFMATLVGHGDGAFDATTSNEARSNDREVAVRKWWKTVLSNSSRSIIPDHAHCCR